MNNQKENKEQKNRQKLMTHPGSQYSISTNEEMEMDYYDYNVVNSSAAPGSYLGMKALEFLKPSFQFKL